MNHPLDLPERTRKPRTVGRTNVLDKGLGLREIEDQLEIAHEYVDLAKLGWGTGLLTPVLRKKIALYQRFDIEVCCGGTLFELFYIQSKVEDYVSWMKDLGLGVVEVSDGVLELEAASKHAAIERLSRDFKVYSEVGSKDVEAVVAPVRWVEAIKAELDAGAAYVILEGRESGTAGMYRGSGEIRTGLIEEIMDAGISQDRLIFEAPKKAQQVWMIEQFGANVNFGNIALAEVIPVETLRLGLRGDTLMHFHSGVAAGA